ncbi:DUF3987 domain-containing protein [Oceanobacillus piezotolerans]|uniref:DUF3987 domain-containing protein n=1 Tax=Oceanobacillus piezotolerans TaxID=2448030 RepID=A0A498DF46_9BACI|nr:YfjI family protein [Oceanobacillus piezotolerans]RLL47828.1 DUF3987 domain-containing protein [Oceanobacillus piezotolerans]
MALEPHLSEEQLNILFNEQQKIHTSGKDDLEEGKKDTSPYWDEPIGFDEEKLPEFNISIFPDWLRDYVEAVSESVQVAQDAPAMACISLLSSILSRKFVIKPNNDWTEVLTIFSAVAMASSERKSPSHDKIVKPLFNYERNRSEELQDTITEQRTWLKAQEKRLNEQYSKYGKKKEDAVLKDIHAIEKEISNTVIITNPRLVTSDATPEALASLMHKNNEKIAVLSAEGKEVFDMIAGRYSANGQPNMDLYLKGYTGESTSIDRKGGDPILLENPCMTVGLFVQPSVIKGIGKEFQNRGLTARFLFSFPRKMAGNRNMEPETIPEEIKNTFESVVEKMLRFESKNEVLTLEEEAGQLFLYNRYTTEELYKDDDLSESFKSWIGKLDGNLIRLAGLFHIAEHAPNGMESIPKKIGVKSVRAAMDLKEYFIEHAKKAYGVMGVSEDDENAKYVLKRIKDIIDKRKSKNEDTGYMSHQELYQAVKNRIGKSNNLNPILLELQNRNFIRDSFREGRRVLNINPKTVT